MLFCVYTFPRGGQRFVAVRREAGGELPTDLAYGADMYNAMDWRATVLLNIAMHTQYELQLCAGKCVLDVRLVVHCFTETCALLCSLGLLATSACVQNPVLDISSHPVCVACVLIPAAWVLQLDAPANRAGMQI